ncbi:uncharacterized protein Dwil_GK27748 [Drosophila willistoni]|uniref:Metchnikowin n=1 Tax=Drosophila willistoni TaxID=7260 RepID=A0A0Q9X6D7_DROWI|nr:uncharacterized protein Dwil_GK27748 [Drosophila willistoni]
MKLLALFGLLLALFGLSAASRHSGPPQAPGGSLFRPPPPPAKPLYYDSPVPRLPNQPRTSYA